MSTPRPCGSFRFAVSIAALIFFQLSFSTVASAQMGTTDTLGGRTGGGTIVVSVRDAAGEPLTTPALVNLYSADGLPVGQASAASGGLVTFRNVRTGSYSVQVEASGYAKGYGEATLPMVGEIDIQIYLHPESKGSLSVAPDSGIPLLAPKAKKELDAGREALRQKDFAKAQKHLEKASEMVPAHPEVLYLLGSLYLEKNDLPRAQEFLAKATQIDPEHAPAQAALGIVLSNEHKCRAALLPLGKALELDAKSWEARWALARCDYSLRNFQPALEQSRQALLDSHGLAPDISLVVAASLSALGQYDESASLLREYLRQNPDRPGADRAKRWLDRLQQAGKIKSN